MNPISAIKEYFSRPIKSRNYTVQIHGRGEDISYTDDDVQLALERTYCDGHRLYCDNTQADSEGKPILLKKRIEIINNLCEHFKTMESESIFVLDIRDKDHDSIQLHMNSLAKKGHKVSVEADSVEIRDKHQDEMYLSILEAGKKLSINGREINSPEEYWRWKQNA